MTIAQADLKAFYPAVVSDDDSCGGRISFNQITSGALQNVFPHVFRAKRVSGNLSYPDHRKIFWRNCNDADETGYQPAQYLFRPNPSDAWVYKVIGTQRSTRSSLTGSEAKYGPGLLATTIVATNTVLVVNVKHADMTGCFAVGRPIRISDKALASSTTGNEEEFTPSAVSVSGTQVTITIPSPGVANGYAAGATVFSVYYPASAELACSVDNWAETSSAGTYDESNYPVLCDNIGTAEQTWTLTMLSATTFSVVGDTVGNVGSGSTSGNFAPVNALVSKPYFTLESGGFSGTWAAGETIVFQTHPGAIPTHEFRCVPANCASMAGDGITLALEVETV